MKKVFISFFLLASLGCTNSENSKKNITQITETSPPPPLPAHEQKICDSLKTSAYNEIRKGEITIIFNDTITDDILHKQFVSILKNQLGFNYFRLYDINNIETLPYKYCVQPIMDSAIAAKYGANAKDSIINEAYGLTEIAYKKGNR